MSSENNKIMFLSLFILLAGFGVGIGLYVNADKHEQGTNLVPLIIGSWVKIPGVSGVAMQAGSIP